MIKFQTLICTLRVQHMTFNQSNYYKNNGAKSKAYTVTELLTIIKTKLK